VFLVGGRSLRTFANAIENSSDGGVIEYVSAHFYVGTRLRALPLGILVFLRAFTGVVISGNSHAVDLSDRKRSLTRRNLP
jgi:hypothetical protein